MTATGRARSPTSSPPPTGARRSSARSRRPRASRTADAMAAIDGVDCLWVGHFDLSVSLGIPGRVRQPDLHGGDRHDVAGDARSTTRRSAGSCRRSSRASRSTSTASTSSAIPATSGCCTTRSPRRSASCARAARAERRAADGRHVPRRALGRFQEGGRLADLSRFRPRRRSRTRRASRWRSSSRPIRIRAEQLEDFDALILLAHRFARESVPKSGRLAVVARFGVGYDTVDVDGLHARPASRSSSRRTACAGRSRSRSSR